MDKNHAISTFFVPVCASNFNKFNLSVTFPWHQLIFFIFPNYSMNFWTIIFFLGFSLNSLTLRIMATLLPLNSYWWKILHTLCRFKIWNLLKGLNLKTHLSGEVNDDLKFIKYKIMGYFIPFNMSSIYGLSRSVKLYYGLSFFMIIDITQETS